MTKAHRTESPQRTSGRSPGRWGTLLVAVSIRSPVPSRFGYREHNDYTIVSRFWQTASVAAEIFGALVFGSLGYLLADLTPSEEELAAVRQLVSFPMMFLPIAAALLAEIARQCLLSQLPAVAGRL